jgi:hypothetical protein
MKKAKLILTSIALLALVGGALAFKASRSSIGKVFYSTQSYYVGTATYTRAGLATFCAPTTSARYWTNTPNAGGLINSLYTSAQPQGNITLTLSGGTTTITIPSYSCTLTEAFTTAAF